MDEDILELFQSIGLSEAKARDTAKNAAVSTTLNSLIMQVWASELIVIKPKAGSDRVHPQLFPSGGHL